MIVRVNQALIAQVQKARLELPEYQKPWENMDEVSITRVSEQCKAYTEAEFAAVVITALHNYPQMVLKVIADELEGKNDK